MSEELIMLIKKLSFKNAAIQEVKVILNLDFYFIVI